jgi:polysaccharide chain length determinant protein (PEP-CTERM system associated)
MLFSSTYLLPYIAMLMKRKGLFIVTALVIMTLGALYTYVIPKKYQASSIVFIDRNFISQLVQGIAINPSMDDSIRVLTATLNSRTLVQKVIADVDSNYKTYNSIEVEKLITQLQRNTQIKVVNTDQFRINFTHTNPVFARDYVNTLVRKYIEGETFSKKTASSDASTFLTEQIDTQKKKLLEIESEVAHFKNTKNAEVLLDAGQLFNQINQQQQKLYDIQFRRKQLEEEKKYVSSATDPSQRKLALLLKRLDELRAQYTENYPEVLSVKSQIEALQEELKLQKSPNSQVVVPQDIWKIDAELKALQQNEATVQRHLSENKGLLAGIPYSKNMLEKLEEAEKMQKSVHDLLAKRNNQVEMSIQMGLQEVGTKFKVVDPAVTPVAPVSPNRRKLLLMSIMAGFAGGATILLLLEKLDHSVKLVDTLKPLGLPILAVIPLIKSLDEVLEEQRRDKKIFAISGAYFSLILAIFLMELLGIGLFEKMVLKLHLPQMFLPFFKA